MVEHVLHLMLVAVQMVGLVNIVLMVSREFNCIMSLIDHSLTPLILFLVLCTVNFLP